MILRAPNFFENFQCLGSDCKKSCCIGWELEVDSDTFDYYNSIEGPFGDRLRSELRPAVNDDENVTNRTNPSYDKSCDFVEACYSFTLPVDGRCPFLNSKNLCDIVLELGDEALCDICSNYPRYTFSFGEYTEKSLTISCEEACRLLFNEKDGITFAEAIYEDNCDTDDCDDDDYDSDDCDDDDYDSDDCDDDFDEPTEEEIADFLAFRESLFKKISDRSLPFNERLLSLPGLSDINKESRLRILSMLEPIDSSWADMMGALLDRVNTPDLPWNDGAYENLLIYFLFRYMPRGLYDEDYISKIRFSAFCIFCIRDIEAVTGDLQLAASMFSREVEHSEENIDLIMEELLFS